MIMIVSYSYDTSGTSFAPPALISPGDDGVIATILHMQHTTNHVESFLFSIPNST